MLLNKTLNFGAIVPDQEKSLKYIIKGMFGGYKARFSNNDFFFFEHNYLSVESRDLWVYQLDLSEFEKELLILHAWELSRVEFQYFFLNHNCASEMKSFLNITDIYIPKTWRFWYAPQDLVQQIPNKFMTKLSIRKSPNTELYE